MLMEDPSFALPDSVTLPVLSEVVLNMSFSSILLCGNLTWAGMASSPTGAVRYCAGFF